MVKQGMIALCLSVCVFGCASFQEIGNVFREDPAKAAFTVSKANLDTITEFRGNNCSPATPDMVESCKIVADVDYAYTIAHNASLEAYTRVSSDEGRTKASVASEALNVAREAVSVAMKLDEDPGRNAQIYIPVLLSISTLRTTLGSIK